MNKLFDYPVSPPEQAQAQAQAPALVALRHMTFQEWFVRMFRQGLLPVEKFTIMEMETEYKRIVWEQEKLWKEWTNGIQE